ncbi:hypothetical protein JG687_00017892 [Phytophthora cactorum]|uniref:Uncharacterized protein n=3 Tax=Phytophthora cactorum TaxID=29920 RepID=A0A8T1CRL8_9STRA|nr:hypothetical protein PC114_g14788 [Phytophthora cactorum]KAG2928415.1 hypothetical protein PC117_g14317 [Phytophthora cactorum]KAG3009733.1 hypothetical protein PC120_g15469 [Phytophthora cactorum]KAG3213519.1 hypothetical protein PC129_g15546 [Phytophthora cactorum]KAG4052836.1 hypothetical protein PC123_g11994 [Phytophthora cactorum]
MRNVFLSFGLAVVISATNASGRDFSFGGLGSKGFGPYVWCEVSPSLPAFTFDAKCVEMESIPDPLKRILQHSRPLFASDALEYIRGHSDVVLTDLGDYLNNIVDWLGPRMRALRSASEVFELGQVALLLSCKCSLADEYTGLIDGHFVRHTLSEPFELEVDSSDRFWLEGKRWIQKCTCTFSPPESDLLLHLVLTAGNVDRSLVGPLHEMIQLPALQKVLDSARRGVNDDMKFEALVVASVVLASRHGGVHGVGLASFLGILLYEVGVILEREDLAIPVDLANTAASKVVIPFLTSPKVA